MRVYIVEPDGHGGLAHFAHLLAQALSEAGAEVTLVTNRDPELGGLPRSYEIRPVLRLWRHGPDPARGPGPDALGGARRMARRAVRAVIFTREWARITRLLLRDRPDFTLFSILRFPIQAVFLRRLSRAGLLTGQICHEFTAREERDGVVRGATLAMNAAGYRSFDAIFFLARATRDAFLAQVRIDGDRTHVIPHGPGLTAPVSDAARAAVRTRYGLAPGERVILFFGGLRPSKGLPDLVDAVAAMRNRAGTRLVVAGQPSKQFDLAGLRSRIHRNGLDDRVTVDPRYVDMDELSAMLSLCTVAVFPYRSATASGALTLAQVLGRPVVATDVGGLAEVVTHGETGLLVPPGDAGALAAALDAILDDPPMAAAMGENGRREALEERAWSVAARRILDIAEDIRGLEGRRRRGSGSAARPVGS